MNGQLRTPGGDSTAHGSVRMHSCTRRRGTHASAQRVPADIVFYSPQSSPVTSASHNLIKPSRGRQWGIELAGLRIWNLCRGKSKPVPRTRYRRQGLWRRGDTCVLPIEEVLQLEGRAVSASTFASAGTAQRLGARCMGWLTPPCTGRQHSKADHQL